MSWSTSHRSCSECRRRMRGFTLIEVMVAISVLAIVLTTVYGMFTSVDAAKQRLDADSATYHRARVVFERLGRELRGAYSAGVGKLRGASDQEGRITLELTTTAVSPLSQRGSGLALVSYSLQDDPEADDDSRVLMRSEQAWYLHDQAEDEPAAMRLAPGIAAMSLRFYTGERWLESWELERDGLPQLVEVSLTLNDHSDVPTVFRSAFELPRVALP